jgi:PmbA protein
MDIREFQTELFEKGREMGFLEMEIYYSSSKATAVRVYQQEIDEYYIAEEGGLSFRGIYNNQMGYSYTEKIDKDSIPLLLEEALNNAEVLETGDQEDLFEGSQTYPEPRESSEVLENLEPESLIEAAFEMEKEAKAADPRIQLVQSCGVSKTVSELLIANTKGLHCHQKTAYVTAGLWVIAGEGEQTATGGEMNFTIDNLSRLNVKEIAKIAVSEAVSKLGAQSAATNSYPVIFRYDAATELLGSFLGLFSAESVQKGYSKFAGKLGEKVAGKNITIIDDPLMADSPNYSAFDSEGFATKRKELINKGVLETFMHNRKTAKKDGTVSTGNAMKGGYRGTISVGPYNVYLQPGERALKSIISTMENGMMIAELQGTNAGINTVSGEFSLSAIGFLIEDGNIVRPVDQITVSGNFFELLNQIEEVANDLDIRGSVTSPSIKVKALSISGNN